MESMITVLYLEKSRKVKQFKAKETMGSYHPSGPVSSPGLMVVLLIVGKCYFLNIWYAFNNHTNSNSEIPKAHFQ